MVCVFEWDIRVYYAPTTRDLGPFSEEQGVTEKIGVLGYIKRKSSELEICGTWIKWEMATTVTEIGYKIYRK